MDFTVKKYKKLLQALIKQDYTFQTFENFLINPVEKAIILRHDVDQRPKNSLKFAEIQHELGISGTYYFRSVPESWDEDIIRKIASLGHEIGYHYENLTVGNGNFEKSISNFGKNLLKLREIAPVSTICMHGSPMSKYDSKDLWKKYDYRDYNLIGEPYFDIDFGQVLYLTDTGRRWDGQNVSVRDKVETPIQLSYHSTDQIILASRSKELPNQIMFTFHPQRWHENLYSWINEIVLQGIKNVIKKYFYVK